MGRGSDTAAAAVATLGGLRGGGEQQVDMHIHLGGWNKDGDGKP